MVRDSIGARFPSLTFWMTTLPQYLEAQQHLSGSLTFTISQTQYSLMVGWNISSISNLAMTGDLSIEPWLLLVEESSYYPDGLNNLQNYEHVLLDAIPLNLSLRITELKSKSTNTMGRRRRRSSAIRLVDNFDGRIGDFVTSPE